MTRLHRRIAPLILAFAVATTSALAEGTFAEHYRRAVSAYQASDAPGFLSAARAARAVRPDSPQAAYLLAAAMAMNGQKDGSLALLDMLAAQGLRFEPSEEPAFASLELALTAPELLQKFGHNGAPSGSATTVLELDDGRFVPEGIAWDGKRNRFLLGSVHQRRVVGVTPEGDSAEFLPPGQGGLLSVFGMQVDEASDSLWLATSGLRESGPIEPAWLGRAGILQFDLETAALRQSFWRVEDGREHVLGDLQLLPGGGALTTDSLSGEVLRLDTATGRFDVIVPAGKLVSPQGLAIDDSGQAAWVADYRGGIYYLDLADGSLAKVAEAGTTHHGIDGLYRYGGWLLAIQNGQRPNRVLGLKLDGSGRAVMGFEVLAAALPEFDDPNLGVIVADRFYFNANSHWPRFDREGRLPDGLSGPIVMSVALPAAD